MLKCHLPASFLYKPFYYKNVQLYCSDSLWVEPYPFKEDICAIPLLTPWETWELFYLKWDEINFYEEVKVDPEIVVLWLARFIQLFHFIDSKYVVGAANGIIYTVQHKAAPWNAEERINFIIEDHLHFTRIIEMKKLIEEARHRVKRYLLESIS